MASANGWKAWENRQPGADGPTLHVQGDVDTTNSNQTPVLSEASPQGINPSILVLNLSITTSGVGITVLGTKRATFKKPVKAGQFTSVDIHKGGQSIATCTVEIVQ